MYECINILRILAAILITNAHYESIYPISIIANGGLLGDAIFFAVSGFCLTNIKDSFIKWYKKRIIRIYPTVLIVTMIYILFHYYVFDLNIINLIQYFIYPTQFHFVSSIMVLYIVYYLIMILIKNMNINKSKGIQMAFSCVAVLYLIYYLLIFDKTYYHIDSVYEWNIRFFFLLCMLLGAWLRENMNLIKDKINLSNFIVILILFCVYFISKLLFIRLPVLSMVQIVNQIILFALLYFIFVTVIGMEKNFRQLPDYLKGILKYLSSLTLEIYLIQYLIIDRFNFFIFPFNFLLISFLILISAMIIKQFINQILNQLNQLSEVK